MKLEKRAKKANIQRIILETVKLAGFIGIAALAPNILSAMKKMGVVTHPRQTESIKKSKDSLIKKGMLEYKKGEIRITQRGKIYMLKNFSLGENNKLNKHKKWDKKWRVLIFDIPENRRFDRNNIRHALVSIGFMRLQDSVWVYPYNCEDLITLLKADTEVNEDVLYMIVDAIEHDEPIREYFGLPKS